MTASSVLSGLSGYRYWTVGLDGVSVSGAAVTVAATSVVIDSGTSAILLGPEDATAIHSVRPSVPCVVLWQSPVRLQYQRDVVLCWPRA